MEQPIWKNGSGYYDPTFYEAYKNIVKGDKRMRNGEIWTTVNSSGVEKEVLVLADHERFCIVLTLDDRDYPDKLQVNCRGIRYIDPNFITYTYDNNFETYIRTLSDEEYSGIMGAVVQGLGVDTIKETVEVEKIVEKVVEVPVEKVVEKVVEVSADASKDIEEIARLKAEAKIYKGMYDTLLKKLIERGE